MVMATAILTGPRKLVPNKTEARYLTNCEIRKRAGELVEYEFNRITFLLAADLRYTPDVFEVLPSGRIRFVEIKGFEHQQDRDKFKVAAERFPYFEWVMVREVGRSSGIFETVREL